MSHTPTKTPAIYGAPPRDLGLVNLYPTEMMFWLYCPVKLPGQRHVTVPDNLGWLSLILQTACADCHDIWDDRYVYITAKTLYVTPENPGNRPGWHSDGFLTGDLNYIWCDDNPTQFWIDKNTTHAFTADHAKSLLEMEKLCSDFGYLDNWHITVYPLRHVLRLDQTVLHRVGPVNKGGMRTFVKISVSDKPYALKGNSLNHRLDTGFVYIERQKERNDPAGVK